MCDSKYKALSSTKTNALDEVPGDAVDTAESGVGDCVESGGCEVKVAVCTTNTSVGDGDGDGFALVGRCQTLAANWVGVRVNLVVARVGVEAQH
jgi:hypothetical protein